MKEFFEIIFGTMSFAMWMAYIALALIGTAVFSATEVESRNIQSTSTPKKFFWKFWATDNIKRYYVTLLIIFINFRFFKDINGGIEITPYIAFLIGFGSDGIAGFGKRKMKVLQADREKLLKENPE